MFGTCTGYNRARGYGFILPDDETLPDYFCHARSIQAKNHYQFLVVGQRVEFTPSEVDGKPQALAVRIVGPQIVANQVSDKSIPVNSTDRPEAHDVRAPGPAVIATKVDEVKS
jgi:cold shock CspA family protein